MLHEACHAHILSIANSPIFTPDEKAAILGGNWEMIFKNQSHGYIASEFVSAIAFGLKEFGDSKGYNLDIHFYKDLAWGGLTKFPDSGTWTPWFKKEFPLSSDRNRIQNVIDTEQGLMNITNQKGKDGGC